MHTNPLCLRKATQYREATLHQLLTWGYHGFRVIHIKGSHVPYGKAIAWVDIRKPNRPLEKNETWNTAVPLCAGAVWWTCPSLRALLVNCLSMNPCSQSWIKLNTAKDIISQPICQQESSEWQAARQSHTKCQCCYTGKLWLCHGLYRS